MGRAIADVLPLAVAVAVFPVPLIAVVLILGSEGGQAKGLAFVLAWLAGLAAVGVVVLMVAGEVKASDGGEPTPWVDRVLLVLGVVLVALAVKGWLGRPRRDVEAPTPRWMRSIDRFTVKRAGGAGFALSALNPKNVLLVVAAATEIAGAGLPAGQRLAVLAVFVLVASAGVLAPLVYSAVAGERSRAPLDSLRAWMTRWNAVIMSLLFLLIGLKLIADAISGLS
jgi:threonine/homoserine/homoserine lactone efflux protein